MQNLLNRADRASTVPNRSSNKFLGKNGALPAQTMTIPVTTGANRDATVLNLGLYRPITGANRERSGSMVECLTRDRRAAGSSLTGVTALCP